MMSLWHPSQLNLVPLFLAAVTMSFMTFLASSRPPVAHARGLGALAGILTSLLAFVITLLFASPARAQDESASGVQVELGVMGGYEFFAHNLELGVADDPALPSPKRNGLFGARAALAFNRTL